MQEIKAQCLVDFSDGTIINTDEITLVHTGFPSQHYGAVEADMKGYGFIPMRFSPGLIDSQPFTDGVSIPWVNGEWYYIGKEPLERVYQYLRTSLTNVTNGCFHLNILESCNLAGENLSNVLLHHDTKHLLPQNLRPNDVTAMFDNYNWLFKGVTHVNEDTFTPYLPTDKVATIRTYPFKAESTDGITLVNLGLTHVMMACRESTTMLMVMGWHKAGYWVRGTSLKHLSELVNVWHEEPDPHVQELASLFINEIQLKRESETKALMIVQALRPIIPYMDTLTYIMLLKETHRYNDLYDFLYQEIRPSNSQIVAYLNEHKDELFLGTAFTGLLTY